MGMAVTTTLQGYLSNGMDKWRNGYSLKARIARGGAWLGLGNGMEHGARFVRNMLLTRLIAPEAFGMIAIVMAINGAFEAFTQMGIKEAVIQSPIGGERRYLNGAWWLSFSRGVLLYVVAALTAPWILQFYNKPALLPLLYVAFLSIFFNGALSPRAYVALKDLEYKRWVVIMHGGSLIGILVAIGLGLWLKSVWALVIGFAVEAGAQCFLSYIVCPYRPSLEFERVALQALFRFSRGIFGLPILAFAFNRADIFVLGKYATTSQLGTYSMSFMLAQIPAMLCVSLVTPILMPTFASIQHDREGLVRANLRTTRYLAWLFLPGLALMASLAPRVLTLVYGSRYALASEAFVLFCATVAVSIIGWSASTTLLAVGRPELIRWASVLRLVVMLGLIVPLVRHWNLVGAALAGLLATVVFVGYIVFQVHRIIGLPLQQLVLATSAGILASGVIYLALTLLTHWAGVLA